MAKDKNKSLLTRYQNNPTLRPLGPKGIRRQANQQASLQFNPQQRQLRQEQQASDLQARRIESYFPQYEHSIKGDRRATTNAYQSANRQIKGASSDATAYAEKLRQRLAGESQTGAALRGVGYDPSASITDATAQLSRIGSADTLRGITSAQGASQRSYLTDQKRIGKREEIDALQQEAARRRGYNQDLENLARERGQAASTAENTLRNQEQQFYLGLLSSHTTAADSKRSAQVSAANSRRSAAQSNINSQRTASQEAANRRAENRRTHFTQHQENRRAQGTSHKPGDQSNKNVHQAISELRYYNNQHPNGTGALTSKQAAVSYLVHAGYTHRTAVNAVNRLLHHGGGHGNPGAGAVHSIGHLFGG